MAGEFQGSALSLQDGDLIVDGTGARSGFLLTVGPMGTPRLRIMSGDMIVRGLDLLDGHLVIGGGFNGTASFDSNPISCTALSCGFVALLPLDDR